MAAVSAVEWVSVDSGLFTAALYREGSRQLYLRFRDGDIYRYFDCPVSVHREFLAAESKGRYFVEHIRNRFRCELIHRKHLGGNAGANLEEQLNSSVQLARRRAVQKRDAAHAPGVLE